MADSRLCRLQIGRFDRRFLVGLPIVVRGKQYAVAVAKLQRRILERVRHVERRERRPESAENNARDGRGLEAGEESADENVVAGGDKAARAQVRGQSAVPPFRLASLSGEGPANLCFENLPHHVEICEFSGALWKAAVTK